MKPEFTLGILLKDINASFKQKGFSLFFSKLKKEAEKREIKVMPITSESKLEEFDIVYDRFFSKTTKDFKIRKKFIKKCEISSKPVFNDNNFVLLAANKWEAYLFLKKNKKIKNYLPKTFLFKKISSLENFLKVEKSSILKPNIGQKGKGIFLIKREKEGYLIIYQDKNFKNKKIKIKKISDIKKFLKEWPRKRYIFQEEINVAKYKNRVFDIRILLQKVNKKWSVVLRSIRLALEESFLSNVSRGGEGKEGRGFYQILKDLFPENYQKIINEIQTISLDVANYFEQEIKGYIFEMGLDFILDKKGKIWIIEVNSKPGRGIYIKNFKKEIPLKKVLTLINFAQEIYFNYK